MKTVTDYTIQFSLYHSEIVARLSFKRETGEIEESALYSLGEVQNAIDLWRDGNLSGSFAIGTQLAQNPACCMVQA